MLLLQIFKADMNSLSGFYIIWFDTRSTKLCVIPSVQQVQYKNFPVALKRYLSCRLVARQNPGWHLLFTIESRIMNTMKLF